MSDYSRVDLKKKKTSFCDERFVLHSSKFPLSHVTSNYEPLHKGNTDVCILAKKCKCVLNGDGQTELKKPSGERTKRLQV